jgi:uncharacterized membrane protein
MSEVTIFATTLFGAGVLFLGFGIPLFQERVPPNYWYGCRTTKSLSDKKIWYTVNRVTGKNMIVGGMLMTVTSMAMFAFRKSLSPDISALAVIGLLIMSTALMVVNGFRTLRRL